MFKKYFFFLAVSFLFLADRLSKQSILGAFSENQSRPLIPGIFHLTRVNNFGAAFGLFRGAGLFLIIATLITLISLSVYLIRSWERIQLLQRIGWTLVTAGALGNLYDRFFLRICR